MEGKMHILNEVGTSLDDLGLVNPTCTEVEEKEEKKEEE